MAITKSDIYHKDYLFWIYPVIILVLLIFAIRRDNRNRESAILNYNGIKTDSSLTMYIQDRGFDYSGMIQYPDSNFRFYATSKNN